MKLSLRSYPHPVVGNRDDVPGAAFQAALDISADKENIYIDASVSCSSSTINELVAAGCACYVLHVECSNTVFRQAYQFKDNRHRVAIVAENLNDVVEVNVFCRAMKNISGYRVEKAHADYGDSDFEIRGGDILALGEGHVFHVDSSFDSLSRIGSVMQIEEAKEEGDLPLRVDFNGEKILIILSKQDFKDYKSLKNQETVVAPLTCTIVLPVLLEALHLLKESDDDEGDQRWMKALRKRIDGLKLQTESDLLVVAQRLLEMPLKRSLAASKQIAEAAS